MQLASTLFLSLKELATRTDLETSKLDYMGEISALKMKFAGYEKEKFETEQRLLTAQVNC